jgi:putative oxidoreductase
MFGFARNLLLLVGRILIAAVFIYDGFVLIHNGPQAGFTYVERYGLPDWSWWLALALELGGGGLIVLGFVTRLVALIFFVFCMMTAFFFHNAFSVATALDFTKGAAAIDFGKDIALAGGFLFLVANGAGRFALDALVKRRSPGV